MSLADCRFEAGVVGEGIASALLQPRSSVLNGAAREAIDDPGILRMLG